MSSSVQLVPNSGVKQCNCVVIKSLHFSLAKILVIQTDVNVITLRVVFNYVNLLFTKDFFEKLLFLY